MPVMIISLSIEVYCTNIVYIYIYKVQLIPYFMLSLFAFIFLCIVFIFQISSSYFTISAPYRVILLFQHLIIL